MSQLNGLVMVLMGVSALTACSQTDVSRSSSTTEVRSPTAQAPTDSSTTPTSTPTSSGQSVKAYIDPNTGELRDPTAEELAASSKVTDKKVLSVSSASEQTSPKQTASVARVYTKRWQHGDGP
jgi:hypothetical protein